MADKQISERLEKRKLETYARTLLEAAKTENRVYENLAPLKAEAEASPEVLSVLSRWPLMATWISCPRFSTSIARWQMAISRPSASPSRPLFRLITTSCAGYPKVRAQSGLQRVSYRARRPAIIGGLILSVNGRRRDASVRHQLEQARKVMTHAVKNSEV